MKKHTFNLRLFDGEGGGSAPAATGGEGAVNVGEETKASNGRRSGKGNEVVYGKQTESSTDQRSSIGTANAQGKAEEEAKPDKKAQFEELIKGEYKDVFAERTNGIVNERFKEMKNLEKFKGDVDPLLDVLGHRYGVENSDVQSILNAMDEDNAYWEAMADEEGLTVEQYKLKQKLERENKRMRDAINENTRRQEAEETYRLWERQAEEMKADYPNFNLMEEAQNNVFTDLLRRGIELRTAYEVTHLNDIKTSVAKKAETAVASTIRANGNRPSENGASVQSGLIVKSDVSKLTRADRAEIARRIARGENIAF